MAQATVKTVQYIDPRIEPQPDPVYDYVIGPTQNQYYKLPASALSNSSINFNNLTTLGIDRAYLDTFELELSATITFNINGDPDGKLLPDPGTWTFDSFPFNKCCDEARVNINGGAFFSQPMSYIRAKERYMNQYELGKSYQNVCPCHRAVLQTESGREYTEEYTPVEALSFNRSGACVPTRYGVGMIGYMLSSQGFDCGFNNAIIKKGANLAATEDQQGSDNYYMQKETSGGVDRYSCIVKVTWREPIFVSPFSSRYDATYGRPLYNITSMDLAFTMPTLKNMIRISNYTAGNTGDAYVSDYNINLTSAMLCYQVMTIPPILNKPLTTLVPYRRFVPYVTEYNMQAQSHSPTEIPITGAEIDVASGVYTLNEMPTAIWMFVTVTKGDLQSDKKDHYGDLGALGDDDDANVNAVGNWDTNRLFAFIKKVNISMANTTQILATAQVPDLYRIAKANGCEDSYASWAGDDILSPYYKYNVVENDVGDEIDMKSMPKGAGSVLRLKPGVDLIVPDQPLIPGANAANMVFQARGTFQVPPHSEEHSRYALWLLFEYVGVAAISPGQCEITMNPLGSGEIMAVSPVMSATSEATEGELEGSGFWDRIKRSARIAGQLAEDGIISMILKRIPGAKGAEEWAKKHGFGEPCAKRSRGGAVSGGAVIGKGLNEWV